MWRCGHIIRSTILRRFGLARGEVLPKNPALNANFNDRTTLTWSIHAQISTQHGPQNAVALDFISHWHDWSKIDVNKNELIIRFAAKVGTFRKAVANAGNFGSWSRSTEVVRVESPFIDTDEGGRR